MFRKHFYHGLLSGIMAAIAAIIYDRIHFFATQSDFSAIINPGTMISLSLIACMLLSVGYYVFTRFIVSKRNISYNILISVLSFSAIIIPISISLPLSVKNPELFPGLAVPMIFFPVISWYTFKPLFFND